MYNWKISYSYLLIAPNLPFYPTVMEPELKKEYRKSHSFIGLKKYHWYYYAVVSTSRHLPYTFSMLQDWSVGRDAVSFLRPGLKFVYQLIYFCSYPKNGAPEFRLLKLMSRFYLMANKNNNWRHNADRLCHAVLRIHERTPFYVCCADIMNWTVWLGLQM